MGGAGRSGGVAQKTKGRKPTLPRSVRLLFNLSVLRACLPQFYGAMCALHAPPINKALKYGLQLIALDPQSKTDEPFLLLEAVYYLQTRALGCFLPESLRSKQMFPVASTSARRAADMCAVAGAATTPGSKHIYGRDRVWKLEPERDEEMKRPGIFKVKMFSETVLTLGKKQKNT
ncbi:hypothetical protein J6590_057153 [Homalodisca vitripennis]|nr:hypothetical protein J6590_057153 [Homalodisca vitripennis]